VHVFVHRPSGARIGVNKKVLYSFAVFHPDLEEVTSAGCDVLLWRDALDRTVSLFFDKCRAAVATDAPQEVQRVLLDALGERDVGALMTLRFDEMVRLLPRVRDQEDHIWPQMQDVGIGHIGEVVDVAWGLPRLGRRLGLDFRRKQNRSVHLRALSYYTAETRAIVERLYAVDYAVRPARPISFRLMRFMGLK
jgi:hypothetical protein